MIDALRWGDSPSDYTHSSDIRTTFFNYVNINCIPKAVYTIAFATTLPADSKVSMDVDNVGFVKLDYSSGSFREEDATFHATITGVNT